MNIVLIVSDTFRQDHFPTYGNDKIIAPNLTEFGKQAIVFDSCYTASFPTVPTRADLMTGRYTFTYHSWGPLSQDEITLAQCLNQAGYLTCAIGDTPFLVRNGYGYDIGFQDFHAIRGQRPGIERNDIMLQRKHREELYCAANTFNTAAQWLERHHNEKFFLYVDTWDPHEPWDPPDYYVRQYYPDYNGEIVNPCYWDYAEAGYTLEDIELAHACYQGEITLVDHWFGRLWDRLRSLDLLSSTAVIFLSDHGYYFGEHGIFGKQRFRWSEDVPFSEGFKLGLTGYQYRGPLHNEVARVPLLIYLPGTESKRINALVSLPDVVPTILQLAGAEIPDTVQTPSLLPLIRGEANKLHDFVVTSAPLKRVGDFSKTVDDRIREVMEVSPSTITNDEWALLYSVQGDPVELYHNREDPDHKTNVADQKGDVVQEMHRAFVKWLEDLNTPERQLEVRRSL